MKKSIPSAIPVFLRIILTVFVLTVVYIISYLPRRSSEGYQITQTGNLRYETGISVSDFMQWNPVGCWWQSRFNNVDGEVQSRGNILGYFYSPLIAVDRKFNYPDLDIYTGEKCDTQTPSSR
jgi:hypothetical protein